MSYHQPKLQQHSGEEDKGSNYGSDFGSDDEELLNELLSKLPAEPRPEPRIAHEHAADGGLSSTAPAPRVFAKERRGGQFIEQELQSADVWKAAVPVEMEIQRSTANSKSISLGYTASLTDLEAASPG